MLHKRLPKDRAAHGTLLCSRPQIRTQEEFTKGNQMARTPNYDFERKERDRQKAAKKAEKLAAKQAAKERDKAEAETESTSTEEK